MTDPDDRSAAIDRLMDDLHTKYTNTIRDKMFAPHLDRLITAVDGVPRPVTRGRMGETRGILVVGPSGSGKSEMILRALTRHPLLQPPEPDRPDGPDAPKRFFLLKVESPATVKGLGMLALEKVGYQFRGSMKQWRS